MEILQSHLPADMIAMRALPGVRPVAGSWLRFDEAFAAQMARREALLGGRPEDVL